MLMMIKNAKLTKKHEKDDIFVKINLPKKYMSEPKW